MNLKRLKHSAIVGALMAASFTAGATLQPVLAEGSGFGVFLQVFDLIKSEYVEKDIQNDALVEGAIRGMLEVLDDPYTRYISSKEFTQMNEERNGSFSGIGIQIGMRDEKLTVIAPIEDTPAWRAGLKAGDHIRAIDGHSTTEMTVDDAVKLIRGKKGSVVKLSIYRDSNRSMKDVPIKRGTIKNKVVKYKMMGDKVGYLRLTSFMQNDATEEMKEGLKKLEAQGMKALVLDIRSNPGGLLPNAVNIGSLFIKDGPIVRIVDRNGKEDLLNASGKPELPQNVPMAVLIDGGSASASEILAGTLKDNKRATLIGTKTFGKGLVQTVHNLSDGSGVAITTNKYLTSGGTDINKKGIEPDIEITFPKEALEQPYSEARDVQLQKALKVLETQLNKK